MAIFELRRRGSTFLFVVVVVAHIVLISAQVTSRSGVPLLQAVAFGLVAQVQRAGYAFASGISSIWYGYADLREVRAENARLQSELGAARISLQQERALAQRSEELTKLLDLKTRTTLQTTAADVLAGSAAPEFRTITIGKGSADGLRPDMAVLAPAGVVGRVIIPSAGAAKVQLLVDRNAAVGAVVERSRSQGVALGQGTSVLRLDFVSDTSDVKTGDSIVTSGIDGIYPKGFLIGKVVRVDRAGGAYRGIDVQPAVDFSRLEDVLVVLSPVVPDTGPATGAPSAAPTPATPAAGAVATRPTAPKAPPATAGPSAQPAKPSAQPAKPAVPRPTPTPAPEKPPPAPSPVPPQ
jgi:rod shape-determining protein MreC